MENKKGRGRPKGKQTDKTKSTYNPEIQGRPKKTQCEMFDADKRCVIKRMNKEKKGQHMNKLVRYKVIHDGEEYMFSTLKQIQDKFTISCAIANRLLKVFAKSELTPYENKIKEQYNKFTVFEKVKEDKTKKIMGPAKKTDGDFVLIM